MFVHSVFGEGTKCSEEVIVYRTSEYYLIMYSITDPARR